MIAERQEGPSLSVIVVSYNTRDMTVAALQSVMAETPDTNLEIIVVDNASGDGSVEAIAAACPTARLLPLGRNIGFAAANNLAARHARGRYLLLLNPDTVILDRAIDRLMAFAAAHPDAMLWGGRTIFADGRLNATSCFRFMSLWSLLCQALGLNSLFRSNPLFNAYAYGGWQVDSERRVDVITGCFLLIERAVWTQLGGFDEAFHVYGEEVDLCQRARALGALPRITPQATIIHHGGASQAIRADKMVRLLNAQVALIRKHWRRPSATFGLALLLIWPWSRMVAHGIRARLTGRGADNHAAWRAIWSRRSEWRGGYAPVPTADRLSVRTDVLAAGFQGDA